MPLALVSDLSRSLLVRTVVATVAVFLFLAIATGALPVSCLAGSGSCAASAAATVVPMPSAMEELPSAEVSAPVAQVAAIDPVMSPTLTDNEVVAGSFSALNLDTLPARSSADLATDDEAPPVVRTVRTVAIHADGTPEIPAAPDATEAPPTEVAIAGGPDALPAVAPLVAAPDDPAPAAVPAAIADPAPATVAEAKPAPAPAARKSAVKAASSGKSATVKGQGANVHADARSASRVVFALAGGSKVSVLGTSKGWVHITDAKGRTGWMYKDYVAL